MGYKVVVIDDQPIIRKSIIKTVCWKDMDCEVVGEAGNGLEGRKLILDKKPDIIITDIKMPGLDGIGLAENIKGELPYSKVILITGYHEFELAQQALRTGVVDLLTKPINNEDIYKAVGLAIELIKNDWEKNKETEEKEEEKQKLQLKINNSHMELRKKFITDTFHGYMDRETAQYHYKIDELGLQASRYLISILDGIDVISLNEIEQMLQCEKSIILMKEYHVYLVPICIDQRIVILFMFRDEIFVNASRKMMDEYYELFTLYFKDKSSSICTMAYSSLYKEFKYGYDAYEETVKILEIGFFYTENKLMYAGNTIHTIKNSEIPIVDKLQEFYEAVEYLKQDELMNQLKKLMNEINLYSNGQIFIVKILMAEICITIKRISERQKEQKYSTCFLPGTNNINEILKDINNLNSVGEANRYLQNYVAELIKEKNYQKGKINPLVSRVIQYIEEHYSENISLEELSHKFIVNSSYLSRIIKKETGKNFVDILSDTRIKEAKRILKQDDIKINEVAELTGYKDYTYFYQVFRKLTGMSPIEYRNSEKL